MQFCILNSSYSPVWLSLYYFPPYLQLQWRTSLEGETCTLGPIGKHILCSSASCSSFKTLCCLRKNLKKRIFGDIWICFLPKKVPYPIIISAARHLVRYVFLIYFVLLWRSLQARTAQIAVATFQCLGNSPASVNDLYHICDFC